MMSAVVEAYTNFTGSAGERITNFVGNWESLFRETALWAEICLRTKSRRQMVIKTAYEGLKDERKQYM